MIWIDYIWSSYVCWNHLILPKGRQQALSRPSLTTNEHFKIHANWSRHSIGEWRGKKQRFSQQGSNIACCSLVENVMAVTKLCRFLYALSAVEFRHMYFRMWRRVNVREVIENSRQRGWVIFKGYPETSDTNQPVTRHHKPEERRPETKQLEMQLLVPTEQM